MWFISEAVHRVWMLLWLLVMVGACRSSVVAPASPAQPVTGARPARVEAGFQVLASSEQPAARDDPGLFGPRDVFGLEWASDPQISPDGQRVVYVRNAMDIMSDVRRSSLWVVNAAGSDTDHRPLTSSAADSADARSPRWSPDGTRLAYIARDNGKAQVFVRWMNTGQIAKLTDLQSAPGDLVWSPDGHSLAFTMSVPHRTRPLARMPKAPKGARWASPPRFIDRVVYRRDGRGYLRPGYTQVFIVPADGGSPRQLTRGRFHHRGAPSWTPDGRTLIISANRRPDWEYEPLDSELFALDVASGAVRALTDRRGPDQAPRVSPDGRYVAYVGFDDHKQGHLPERLYVLERKGSGASAARVLWRNLDRVIKQHEWSADSRGLYIRYDDKGDTKVAYVRLDDPAGGRARIVAEGVGGTSIGRPYAGGSFSVARNGRVAFTINSPSRPADVAVIDAGGALSRRTALNDDLLAHKTLGEVEELWFASAHDQRRVQGWLLKPPGFDPSRKYPLILEIHGGPFAANYGARFSAECQLYAAAGYLVLFINQRGSTGYGAEFANLIHHAYPGRDYDDLMAGVDHVLARDYVDGQRLFVTGGSGGGSLTAWVVGKTRRFRAAVVAKPVINWYSFILTADRYHVYQKYWFPGYPWDHAEHYHQRSPLSLVGNVETPTMLLTGEADRRTPISESEQYYQALKLRQIDTALVRFPGAGHHIARRPSQLIAKVIYILAWFQKYDPGATSRQ